MERTRGDGNRAVLRGVDGVRLSCLQGRANTAFLLCKKWLKLSCALLSQHLYIREFCVRLPFRLLGILLFVLHVLHLRVCNRDRGRWNVSGDRSLGVWQLLICTDWAKIAERHGLNAQLQTKSYDCSEGRRPYEYTYNSNSNSNPSSYNKSIPPSFAGCNFRG